MLNEAQTDASLRHPVCQCKLVCNQSLPAADQLRECLLAHTASHWSVRCPMATPSASGINNVLVYEGHPKSFQPQHIRQQYFPQSIHQSNVHPLLTHTSLLQNMMSL